MNFKAIGFDYSGVIAGISSAEFSSRVINLLNVDPQIFKEVYYKFNKLVNTNVLTPADFWRKILEELGVSNKYDELIKFIQGIPIEIDEQVLGLVDQLKTNGYKVGLLSNNTIAAAEKFKETGLANHFDVVVVSAEIGFSKPDPKAFQIFAERLGVKVGELIFIDDTEKSLSTAKEVGYYPILFTNYESLIEKLKLIGVRV
jgi:putative hydrolase of the HAD superfamily